MMSFDLTLGCPFCSKATFITGKIDERLWTHPGVGNRDQFIAAEVAPFAETLSQEMTKHIAECHPTPPDVTAPSGS